METRSHFHPWRTGEYLKSDAHWLKRRNPSRKRSFSNRRKWKCRLFLFMWKKKHFWLHDDHLISMTNPKLPVIVVFTNFSRLVWTEISFQTSFSKFLRFQILPKVPVPRFLSILKSLTDLCKKVENDMDHEERTPILKEPLSGYQDLALSARLKMFFTS